MRTGLDTAMGMLRTVYLAIPGLDRPLGEVLDELRDAYAALPPSKGEHAPPDATLAERIAALAGDARRWRRIAETSRSQLAAQREVVDRHDIAATAAGQPPHAPGARRDDCPGCRSLDPPESPRPPELSGVSGSIPAADDVPAYLTDALFDGLAVPGSGGISLEIPAVCARGAVVMVLRAWQRGDRNGEEG